MKHELGLIQVSLKIGLVWVISLTHSIMPMFLLTGCGKTLFPTNSSELIAEKGIGESAETAQATALSNKENADDPHSLQVDYRLTSSEPAEPPNADIQNPVSKDHAYSNQMLASKTPIISPQDHCFMNIVDCKVVDEPKIDREATDLMREKKLAGYCRAAAMSRAISCGIEPGSTIKIQVSDSTDLKLNDLKFYESKYVTGNSCVITTESDCNLAVPFSKGQSYFDLEGMAFLQSDMNKEACKMRGEYFFRRCLPDPGAAVSFRAAFEQVESDSSLFHYSYLE